MTNTTNTTKTIAQTIMDQINAFGYLTRAELGVTHMVAGSDCVILHCLRGLRAIITMTPAGTYTVQVRRVAVNLDWKVRCEASDVYAKNLVNVLRAGILGWVV
jgi:DNA-directed RNA polymerase specialized sigma54-like protein